jgi:superfamily II DNA or RNA helicase
MSEKLLKVERAEQIERLVERAMHSYQVDASEKSEASLRTTGRSLIDMAMGLGKTRVAVDQVVRLAPKRVLILADQEQIIKDHKPVFDAFLGEKMKSGFFTGDDKGGVWSDMVFATFQGMGRHRHKFEKDAFDMIIVDEAHHSMAATYMSTLGYFEPKYLLGLTGTPDRTDWKDIRDVFGPPVVSITLAEAMRNGWLTPVDYRVITSDIDEQVLAEFMATHSGKLTKFELKKLNRDLFKKLELEDTLKHLVQTVGNKQTAIMCESIQEAEQVAYILRQWGYVAEGYHIRSDDNESLARFRLGTSQFLTAVNKMNEGVDVPELEAVAFLRSTDSKRIFLQQLGRALRLYPNKKEALVLDYVASIDRIEMINSIMKEAGVRGEQVKNKVDTLDTDETKKTNTFRFDEKVVNKILELLESNERRYASYVATKNQVWELRFKNPEDYRMAVKSKKHKNLPKNPEKVFGGKFEGWREYLGVDRFLRKLSPDEVFAFVKENHIKTPAQYRMFAELVLKDYRCLPTLEELYATGMDKQLGLKKLSEIDEANKFIDGFEAMLKYQLDYYSFNYQKRRKKNSDSIYGLSGYVASKEEVAKALDRMLAIGKRTIESSIDFGLGEHTLWEEVYSLETKEAEIIALKNMRKLITSLEQAGLLIPEFFLPEIFDAACSAVLSEAHDKTAGDWLPYREAKMQVLNHNFRSRLAYEVMKNKKSGNMPQVPRDAGSKFVYGNRFEGWREYLGVERYVTPFSLEETKKILREMGVKTTEEYACLEPVIFAKMDKRLPTRIELFERGEWSELGLLKGGETDVRDLERVKTISSDLVFELYAEYLWYPTDKLTVTSNAVTTYGKLGGVSDYILEEEQKKRAVDRLLDIAEGNSKSFYYYAHSGDATWEGSYLLDIPEAKEEARIQMKNLLSRLERAGLLTEMFFSPIVFDRLCQLLLADIHLDYYGEVEKAQSPGEQDFIVPAKRGPRKGKSPLDA